MMWILWTILGIVGVVVVLCAVLAMLGKRLPEEHVASKTILLNQKPQAVWDVIADINGHKNWVRGITKLERLPDRENREVWRQVMGRNSFVLETTASQPPTRLVRSIADDNKFFSGNWEYVLSPEGEGTRVTLTEHGRVHSAIPRAMMEYVMGKDTFLAKHLKELAAKFGEPVRMV